MTGFNTELRPGAHGSGGGGLIVDGFTIKDIDGVATVDERNAQMSLDIANPTDLLSSDLLTAHRDEFEQACETIDGESTLVVEDSSVMQEGQTVTGDGIPDGTTILSITDGTTIELSAAATDEGSPTLTFGRTLVIGTGATGGGGGSGLLSDWDVSTIAANPGALQLAGKRYTAPGSTADDFARVNVTPSGFMDGDDPHVWGLLFDFHSKWTSSDDPFPSGEAHLAITVVAGSGTILINGVQIARNDGREFPWEQEFIVVPDDVPVTTDATAARFRMPTDVLLHTGSDGLRISCRDESSGGDIEVDLLHNGGSVLTDPLVIDEGDRTSANSSSPVVIDQRQLVDYAEMTVSVVSAGTDVKGLRIMLRGIRHLPD